MRTHSVLAAVLSVLLVIGGCALVDGKHQVGDRLLRWTQGADGDLDQIASLGTVVIADEQDREKFVAVASQQVNTEPISRVRLDSSFLVVRGFHRCQEESRLWMDDRKTAVWVEVFVPRSRKGVACAWSPMTVDVYRVDRSELGDTPADRLRTAQPK